MPRYDRGGRCTPFHIALPETLLGEQLRHNVVKPFLLCKMNKLVKVNEFFIESDAVAHRSDLIVQSRERRYDGKQRAQDPSHLI